MRFVFGARDLAQWAALDIGAERARGGIKSVSSNDNNLAFTAFKESLCASYPCNNYR